MMQSSSQSLVLRWLGRSLTTLSLGLLVSLSVLVLLGRLHGDQLLSVQTGSMEPVLWPGDAVVVRPLPLSGLHPGAIISYRSPHNPAVIITHRLIAVNARSGWLTTRGDALHATDPTISPRLVVGQVWAVAPRFGKLLDALHRPAGLVLAVYGPGLLVIIAEVRRLIHHYDRQPYRLLGAR
jgi:signal peptidase